MATSSRNAATSTPKQPPVQEESLAAAMAAARALLLESGIGTLNERTLHSTLKCWLQPNVALHEVPIAGCVADIFDGERVTEIQTGGLFPLKKKLGVLLAYVPVTVVVPLPREKWLCWIDPETGERSAPRRSPKRGKAADVLPELCFVWEFWNEGATAFPLFVRVLLLDMEESRLLDGWGQGGKRGSHRVDRVPLAVAGECSLESLADVAALLSELPAPFTRKDVTKWIGKRGVALSRTLRFLETAGLIRRAGKQGNTILFERNRF